MSLNYNRVMIAGNLTRDPQMRKAGQAAVCDMGIAINRRYKGSDGEMREETTFVDVECWGRTAELVGQYLTKGRGCLVEGRLKLDSWETQDGSKRSKIKVVAESVQFTDSKQGGGERREEPRREEPRREVPAVVPVDDDTEPPF